jgi:hypothetical protein
MKDSKWRAGSKRQDLNALAGIIMAWQVGVRDYEKKMKVLKNRRGQVEDFIKN